jgi:hypothetical protein
LFVAFGQYQGSAIFLFGQAQGIFERGLDSLALPPFKNAAATTPKRKIQRFSIAINA